jgi:predicted nucleic acid-binding protein
MRAVLDPIVSGLEDAALILDDPPTETGLTPHPDDNYLVALTRATNADYLISGDKHLTSLTSPHPLVLTPQQFLDKL